MSRSCTSPPRNLLQVAFVFAALLLLTVAMLSVATAQTEETRTVGVIAITADTFTDLGGGLTQAQGHVRLGDHLYLTGPGDAVVFDASVVTGTGSLALGVGGDQVPLFTGPFHAVGATGIATPAAGIAYDLTHVAGFPVTAALTITQVSIPPATVTGAAGLHLTPPGVDAQATADFTVGPGPTWAGSLASFGLATAGVTLQAPAGASLSNNSIHAPTVTLTLPAYLGGASITVNDLSVSPDSLSLGSAGVSFALPNLLFGDGSKVKFTANHATLDYDGAADAYRLTVTNTLSVNLPENSFTTATTVTLAHVGGQSQLSGAVDQVSLAVAGATLAMTHVSVGNSGLHVGSATFTLPSSLGGAHASVYNVAVTGDGLSIGGSSSLAEGSVQFPIPTVKIGDGNEVSFQHGSALLAIAGSQYRLDVSADLALNLPANSQTIAAAFHIQASQVSGTLDAVHLSVAGCTLTMTQVALGNAGLRVDTATLALPPALGGSSVAIANIQVGDNGLVFDHAGAQFSLPDVAFAGGKAVAGRSVGLAALAPSGSFVVGDLSPKPRTEVRTTNQARLSLTNNQATLATLADGSGYTFHAAGTLHINLPGNAQPPRAFTFDLSHNATSGFLIQGQLDALTLTVAGTTVSLTKLALGNEGFAAQTASLTLPSSLGGSTITLTNVSITGDGLQIGGGAFDLPDIKLASGHLDISNARAGLQVVGDAYHLTAQGTLAITLPENALTLGLAFGLDGGGHLTGTISQVALGVAGAGLTLTQVSLSDAGLATTNALLRLPADLGSPTAVVTDVRITGDGLTFGQAQLNVTLPNFDFGGYVAFTQNAATLSITNTGASSQYQLTAQSRLNVNLPDNAWHKDVAFTLRRGGAGAGEGLDDYHLSGSVGSLSLSVAGLTLTMQSVAIANDGLHVGTADLLLPPGLGGATVVVTDVSVTSAGLVISSADAEVALPDFEFGSGAARDRRVRIGGLARLSAAAEQASLALRGNRARLQVTGGHFTFQVNSTLYVTLPSNAQTSAFSFQIAKDGGSYQLAGTLDQLTLSDVAGCSLAMTGLALSNDGLAVGSATLTLPPSLGASATVNDVRITGDGLSIGGGSFALPPITFGGDGSQIKVTNTVVALEISGSDYVLTGTGKLNLRLPSHNAQDLDLRFTVRDGAFDANLSALNLAVAGTTLALQNIDFDNAGLHVVNATITLPASLGSASGTLRSVSITEDGLSVGGGSFALPDIQLGDGSKVKISGLAAELAVQGSSYTLVATGTLNLNLPGNQQNILTSFQVDSTGNMVGHLNQVKLNVAGSTLTMSQVTLSNQGLTVSVATIQLPASLGGGVGTVNNVRITADGLQIGGGSFSIPDIQIGDGSKLKINQPTASFSAGAGGYTFAINGTLQVRLPQNSQDIAFTAQINPAGQVNGTVSQLTLKMASLTLGLQTVSFSNSGLTVAKGTLDLTKLGGRADFQVSNVTIDKDGLHIGGAGATFTMNETIYLGGKSTGFRVQLQQGTVGIADDKTYKLTLVGMVQLEVPGNSGAQASGTISVDSNGNFSGSVQTFTLTVAGLSLTASGVQINGDTLSVASATLNIPKEWGGAAAALYNVTISKQKGLQIGGGSFTLPPIKAGGFTVSASGTLQPDGDGYLVQAGGQFGVPGLGGSGSCSLAVDVTLQSHGQTTVLTLSPVEAEPRWARNVPRSPDEPGGLYLKQVHVSLNCTIPIGDTGFALTRVEGTVTLNQGSTTIEIGVSVESTALQVAGQAALRGDVDMTMCTSPAEFGLAGSIYVFAFHAGQLNVTIKQGDGFRGTLWIEAIVARGSFYVHAWSQSGRFHLAGSATVQIGIPEGAIYTKDIPYPCCTCKWYKCYKKSCWEWCYTHIRIPPDDLILGNINVQFGEFAVDGGGTAYGFKGWVSVLGYNAGVFVNDSGRLYVGNVDKYHLIDSQQVAGARQSWREKAKYGEDPDRFTFLADGTTLINVPITTTTDVIFALSRNAAAPTFSIITPGGQEITPGHLPANVQYQEVITRVVSVPWSGGAVTGTETTGCSPCQRDEVEAAGNVPNVRAFNAAPDVLAADGSRAVDVLVDDVKVFGHVPYTDALYAYLEPGTHTLKVLPADLAGPVLVTATLNVVTDTDHTVVVLGQQPNVQTLSLVDESQPAVTGTAKLRFVHAAPDTPALDVAVKNGPVLFSSVAFKGATGYLPLPAASYDLELRAAGTTHVLLDVPGEELRDGSAYTLFACGLAGGPPGAPPREAASVPDVYVHPITQTIYTVHQAQAGTWRAKLVGETGPDDHYALSVLGSNPPPQLSEIDATSINPTNAQVNWRLHSEEANTSVSIYVTRGPLTTTHPITQANGLTATQVLTVYTGAALARNLAAPREPAWINGAPQTYTLDLSPLESGTYWVWLRAEDMRNPPVQVYAPDPIVVTHDPVEWDALAGWDARISATPGYRQLDVRWNRCPHPDVDSYVLYVSDASLSATRAITVGDAASFLLTTLEPGQTYYLSVVAYDEDTGREALSRPAVATTGVAGFAMTVPTTTLSITGGQASQVVVTLTTALPSYPEVVGLYAGSIRSFAPWPFAFYLPLVMKNGLGGSEVSGVQSSVPGPIVDGIDVSFARQSVTPTVAGVPVCVTISATHSLPGGDYQVPLIAHGGGVTRTVNLLVRVLEPRFTLTPAPSNALLGRDETTAIIVSAAGTHGENDAIYLDLRDAPPGLSWSFSPGEVVFPGSHVTLTLTDTHMLAHGQYPLQIVGEDGENTESFSLTLTVWEPGFGIETPTPRGRVLAGQVAVFPLDVTAENDWSVPVTLTLDAQTIPTRTAIGFLEQSDLTGLGKPVRSEAAHVEIIVTPPGRVFLAVATRPDTPAGLYLIRVLGAGDALQRSVVVALDVYEEPARYVIYLPLAARQ